MKNINLKPLIMSSFLLFASQLSAQESNSEQVNDSEGDDCYAFPECTHGANAVYDEDLSESQWKLLWEKISRELEETIESKPSPNELEQ